MRLSQATLAALPATIARPAYDPATVRVGIVHFGPGAFHRAHQGDMIDRLLARDPRWGIAAVSLRSAGTVEALAAQDGLYTLSILDAEPTSRILAPHRQWIGPGGEAALHARLADPAIRLVTATVTEKGYCLAADGALDHAHPDIAHDLAEPRQPRSFPGWLVAGLAARRAAGLPAFATLSCDNLGQNGRKLGAAVIALAETRDPDLARWIAAEARFPDTMVDSITPASDPAFLAETATALGVEDRAAVKREGFTQWVIEETDAPLPDLAGVGATLTGDVAAWERAKLRILNGAHSALAYRGLLRGHETVADAMADTDLARSIRAMIDEEVIPGLAATRGLDRAAYADAVFARFRNSAIGHRLSQIAWDGSQKLPYRLLDSIAEAIAAGRPHARLVTAVAAWMAFCTRQARAGTAIVDPLADTLADAGRAAAARAAAGPFLALPLFARFDDVFGAAVDRAFVAAMRD